MPDADPIPSESLFDDGLDALGEGRLDDVLEIARKLEARRYSGAFELRALALEEQGDKEGAVAALQEGLESAPDVWRMWQLLGNLSSDLGHYDEARASFERALACAEVERSSVQLNLAILEQRREDYQASLHRLDVIDDPSLWAQVTSVRMTNLLRLGHLAALMAAGEELVARVERGDEGHGASVAYALGSMALGAQQLERPREVAEQLALRALAYDIQSEHLLWILREVRQDYTEEARLWRLVLDGSDGAEGTAGFYIVHQVVADTAYEALELAREVQALRGYEALEIDDYDDEGPHADLPKGVYDSPGRIYYESRD